MYGQGIDKAELPGHSTLSAANAFHLRRTLDPWDEAAVTWATQPGVDPVVSASQPSSVAATEASLLLHQEVEVHYGEVTFATSDHVDPALHPRLTVDYRVPAP